jgi:16S rRNA (cytosine967-C5)-methyltransferase
LKRAECRNVQVIASQAALSALDGQMDFVLVDAPCTGTGTWRRRPDAKWRLSQRQMEVRMREQSTIVDAVARFVKPGGAIAFITCSVFRDENQQQAHGFLARNPDFSFADHNAIWAENFGAIDAEPRIAGDGIVLTPATTATDGFYFAMLRKAG